MIYSINEGRIPTYAPKKMLNIDDIRAVYAEGEVVKDCSYLITESMVEGCMNNVDIVRNVAILEGAKIDLTLSNFLKEGKDYKGLKKDLKQIIAANDMDKSNLASKGKGLMHICKRILQICEDIGAVAGGVTMATAGSAQVAGLAAAGMGAAIPVVIVVYIIGFTIGFIINRLFRLLWDTIEFETIKNDAEEIVSDLRAKAKNDENEQLAKKFNSEADKLEAAIKKWSAKGDKKN